MYGVQLEIRGGRAPSVDASFGWSIRHRWSALQVRRSREPTDRQDIHAQEYPPDRALFGDHRAGANKLGTCSTYALTNKESS